VKTLDEEINWVKSRIAHWEEMTEKSFGAEKYSQQIERLKSLLAHLEELREFRMAISHMTSTEKTFQECVIEAYVEMREHPERLELLENLLTQIEDDERAMDDNREGHRNPEC